MGREYKIDVLKGKKAELEGVGNIRFPFVVKWDYNTNLYLVGEPMEKDGILTLIKLEDGSSYTYGLLEELLEAVDIGYATILESKLVILE